MAAQYASVSLGRPITRRDTGRYAHLTSAKVSVGDYTLTPGQTYRYRVVARYGQPGTLTNQDVNDSNSLVIRGHTAIVDIYATDFMRMFEQYHFRASKAAAGDKPLGLVPDDSWSAKYYVPDSMPEQDCRMFAGTL
jgi:hypothetical protein